MRTLLVVVCVACDAGAPNLPSPQAPVADPHAAQDLANGFDSAVLGVLTPRPVEAGRYGMAIDVSFNAGEVRSALHGWMTLELAPDGTAYSCIAAETADERGVSRATAALAGAWKLVDGVAQIAFHGIAPRAFSCHPEKDADKDAANKAANKAARELDFETTSIATTMSCIATGATAKLPADAIACIETAVEPSLASIPNRRGRGLVLSRSGIHVEVEQVNAPKPTISFAPTIVEIELAFYRSRHRTMSF